MGSVNVGQKEKYRRSNVNPANGNAAGTEELIETNRQLAHRIEQLRLLVTELCMGEERERRRLAGILHDDLQQYLVGVKMNLEILSTKINGHQEQSFSNAYEQILESINISKSLNAELAPTIPDRQGPEDALQKLERQLADKYDFSLDLEIDPEAGAIAEDVFVLLLRSVRDLLVNVSRTADIRKARLKMEQKGRFLDLVMTFPAAADIFRQAQETDSFKLVSMREKLEMLGGSMDMMQSPDEVGIIFAAPVSEEQPEKSEAGGEEQISGKESAADTSGVVRVLLADDHVILRQALSTMLEEYVDIHIVGEASDGEEAIRLAEQLDPDVILMDISMPKMDGFEATRKILGSKPDIRIVGLSMHERDEQARVILMAGAAAYCSKAGNPEALLVEIRKGRLKSPGRNETAET